MSAGAVSPPSCHSQRDLLPNDNLVQIIMSATLQLELLVAYFPRSITKIVAIEGAMHDISEYASSGFVAFFVLMLTSVPINPSAPRPGTSSATFWSRPSLWTRILAVA